jgi:tetratricopeptide (TPR) repeat protein
MSDELLFNTHQIFGVLQAQPEAAKKRIQAIPTASSISALFGAMYPVYLRGEAYISEGQGANAAAEFQKILDHRGIVVSDPVGAVARLQLGRAYALAGNKSRAKAAYQDFLTLWIDADSDVPILKQAKAEYSKLL